MPAAAGVQVIGVEETVKELRKVNPEYRKEFNRGIKTVLAPMVAAAKSGYPDLPLSGMARSWNQGGRQLLPWSAANARKGVKVKTRTSRGTKSVVRVQQMDPAAAIFEVAGTGTRLGRNLRARNPRVLWPAYDRFAYQINAGVIAIVRKAEAQVQGRISR